MNLCEAPPLNQESSGKLLFFKGNLVIFALWFLFNHSIKLWSWWIFGVLNSPFIKWTIFFKPTTGETTNTQALSCNLYLIKPDPVNYSNFLAKGSFFRPKVIQNLGLCFLFSLSFWTQICPSPSNKPAKYPLNLLSFKLLL